MGRGGSLEDARSPTGDQVLVGGIRGKILGGGWVEGVVQKQHPSGPVTFRIHGRNHVVSGKEVFRSASPSPFGFPLNSPVRETLTKP